MEGVRPAHLDWFGVVTLPGYNRPLVRVADYLELVSQCTYSGDRVRPT